MKKKISKEQIIQCALELMRQKSNLSGINLREIARNLGCAHTNLYNYFPSYGDLLWETHSVLLENFSQIMKDRLRSATNYEDEFKVFFKNFPDTYLENKGWFKLACIEYIGEARPKRDIMAEKELQEELVTAVTRIWRGITGGYPQKGQVEQALHSTHCYIVGEVTNQLLGKGRFDDEEKLKIYVTNESMKIFSLCILEG